MGGLPLLPVVAVAAVSLIIFVVMNPWLIFSSTTPTGGDMGAHVFGPAYLRDHLIPEGRLIGWSNDWFAGFPAFYFYFPLPSLTIVALDLLLPYGVAFKLVTVMGLLALPPAIYFFTRSLDLNRYFAVIASGVGAVFAFYESYSIYGGNIASTLAGEFAYSWSFSLSLVYLGLLIKAVRDDRKYAKWAALALALTALSHVLTTIVVIFASLFVLGWQKGFWRTLAIWVWGFAIAAFWALPLIARIGLSSDMAWTPLSRWEEIFPVEIWMLLPIAIPGAIWAMRRNVRAAPLIGATLLPIVYFPLPNVLPDLLPDLFDGADPWKLYNGRLLPYWYFGVAFFAAIGLAAGVMWLSRRLPSRISTDWRRLLILIAFAVAAGLAGVSNEFPAWAVLFIAVVAVSTIAFTFVMEGVPPSHSTAIFSTLTIVALGLTTYMLYLASPNRQVVEVPAVIQSAGWGLLILGGVAGIALGLVRVIGRHTRDLITYLGAAALLFGIVGFAFTRPESDPRELSAWIWVLVIAVLASMVLYASRAKTTIRARPFLASSALAVVALGALAGMTFVDGWARWNYEGYEAKEPWPEYEALMLEIDELPPGRVMWENNSELNQYGTPMSPMLIPYWTEGSHKSMEGLFFESSLTTQFHFINHSEMSYRSSNPVPGLRYYRFDFDRGIRHMDVYGVDYYVAFTPEAVEKADSHPDLELIKNVEPGPFSIYRLPPTEKVEVATHLPAVYPAPEQSIFGTLTGSGSVTGSDGEALPSFHDLALDWYDDIDDMDRWVVSDGPEDWPRIESLDERPNVSLEVPEDAVSNIVIDDHRISFTTDAVGQPHMIKVSYFPNWEATGAEGPWQAAPSLMVVVPTENEVVLEFNDTWAESIGQILSGLGILALLGVGIVISGRRRAARSGGGSGSSEGRPQFSELVSRETSGRS
jgi:hypothetical protein